jgi:hypothetical protein
MSRMRMNRIVALTVALLLGLALVASLPAVTHAGNAATGGIGSGDPGIPADGGPGASGAGDPDSPSNTGRPSLAMAGIGGSASTGAVQAPAAARQPDYRQVWLLRLKFALVALRGMYLRD